MYYDYIVDKSCNDNLCVGYQSNLSKTPSLNNFSDDSNYLLIYQFIYILVLVLINILICIYTNYKYIKNYKLLLYWNCLYLFLNIIKFILDILNEESICNYDFQCYIHNNTLYSSKYWYKLNNDKCPHGLLDIIYKHEIYYGLDNPNTIDNNCKNSNFDCCLYNNQCSFAINSNSNLVLYKHYLEYDNGFLTSPYWKNDEDGSNCKTVLDIIIDLTEYYDKNYINKLLFIIIFNVIINSLLISYNFIQYKKIPQLESNHVVMGSV